IAKQYLFTGLIMAAVGGFLAYGMRHQLAFPGETIPGMGKIGPEVYNSIVTMHGTIMVFWVAMPILLGAFGNMLIPLMVGAKDMAFPRLNMMSYWTFLLSTIVLVASFFVPGGAAASGWTAYPSLSIKGIEGNQLGQVLWILAVALEFSSMLMGGVNFLTTPLNLRAPGMKLMDMPLFVWMQMTASVLFMLSVGPLIAGALLLLLDIVAGTGIFLAETGGDPLLWQHLFWFFGHPEVYVLLLPSLGIVAEVLPTFSRKPFFGYKAAIYSTMVAGVLSFLVWAHHQFISGIDPRLAMPFSVTTILISVPFAILLFSYIATMWGGSIRFTTAMLFGIGLIAEFMIGGCTGIFNGSSAADIYIHDSYFVVAHFHFTLVPVTFLGMFAGLYYWWPKMFGRPLDELLGRIHAWGTLIFLNLVFIPQFLLGSAGMHRRIADPTRFAFLADYQWLQVLSTYGVYGLLIFQVPFVVAVAKGLVGKRSGEANPWSSCTLEWLASSPPSHENFETVPTVRRGPYEYSVPGAARDFVPQWE
ncbi:MAG: cbb3-type cytochrome c oxidase subunit I, partial [Planctomycetota bacterium]